MPRLPGENPQSPRVPLFRYHRVPVKKGLPPEVEISLGPSAAWVLAILLSLMAAAFGLELPGPWPHAGWFR